MESDRIEKVLEKYFEATTTVSEEAMLRTYFSQDGVAEHLQQFAPMFQYYREAKEEQFTKQVRLKSPQGKSIRKLWYTWGSVAAMVVIMVGVYFNFNTPTPSGTLADEYTREEIVAAQEALALLSTNFSKGTEQLSYLSEFERNTNRFLNEKQ
jgi:hypothetical protein